MRGVGVDGGYADFLAVDRRQLIVLPTELPGELYHAAALPISFTTAWQLLHRRAALVAGETVLVLGAAGTIGIAAVQLGKMLGATVIAAASTEQKLDVARRLGADTLINYGKGNLVEEVRAATGGHGVDVVVEHIGAATWEASLASLARNGRLAMCGASSGWNLQFDARQLWRRNITFHFSNSGTTQSLEEVVSFWLSGRIRPVIAGIYPLEQAVEAHRQLDRPDLIGKIILGVAAGAPSSSTASNIT
jgi:NADPH:quinone reductase-like Zn-dependent oxidoreductase